MFHFRDRRRLIVFNGVLLFILEIPSEVILLCIDYDVAFRLENNKTWKK